MNIFMFAKILDCIFAELKEIVKMQQRYTSLEIIHRNHHHFFAFLFNILSKTHKI